MKSVLSVVKKSPPVFTSLGMHFVNVSADQVVLVQVEINVRGLLAVHGRRLVKSKRGAASASSGTVRMTLATPGDREIAHAVAHSPGFANERVVHEVMNENDALRAKLDRLGKDFLESTETIDCMISECNRARIDLARLQGQGC